MKKKNYVEEITFGTILSDEAFVVKNFYEKDGNVCVLLSDRTGSIDGIFSKSVADIYSVITSNVGNVVLISGVVLSTVKGGCNVPEIRIKGCAVADSFNPEELYEGISEETARKHIAEIKRLIGIVKHEGYRALLDVCLSDEALEQLATYPASHDYYGKYRGGALVATCAITNMVGNNGTAYTRSDNGMTTKAPCWDLLVTAALLHQIGKLRFYDASNPFKKSLSGLMMNYYPTLQSMIEEALVKNNIVLNDMDKGALLNILNVATSGRTDSRTFFAEGIYLRHTCHMYEELEYFQWVSASMEFDEDTPYIYNARDNRHYFRALGVINPAVE